MQWPPQVSTQRQAGFALKDWSAHIVTPRIFAKRAQTIEKAGDEFGAVGKRATRETE